MNVHRFKVHAPLNPREAYVEMDGKPIDGVTEIIAKVSVDKLTTVQITIIGYIDFDAEFNKGEVVTAVRNASWFSK